MRGTWRASAKPIIQQVLRETRGQSEKEIRKALKDAYPWGERNYHPYKIWCDEIRVQRGLKRSKSEIPNPDQTDLF
jgi:hypothetical protein